MLFMFKFFLQIYFKYWDPDKYAYSYICERFLCLKSLFAHV